MHLRRGTKLGPYEIISVIGAGGMGEVYKAEDSRLHRSVAIKVLPLSASDRVDIGERFRNEARTLASLNHPHICSVFDVGRHEGRDYLVMELLEGQSLAQRLEKGPPRLDEALQIAMDITDALDKAHRQGIIHRDLKPANVMLTANGAKLLDFGLAKVQFGNDKGSVLSQAPTLADLTAQGTIVGTLQYMSPEQLDAGTLDARSDIFSLGGLLHELFTGKKAFEGKSQAGLIAAIMNAETIPMSQIQPNLPPALDPLVRGCLNRDPAERWQTAHDVLKQLQWIHGSSTAVQLPAVSKERNRYAIWIAAILLLIIGAGAFAIRSVFDKQPAPEQATFSVVMPARISLAVGENSPGAAAISPDGSRLILRGVDAETGKTLLYVRPVGSLNFTPLAGTEDGASPFWAPNGQSIAYFAHGQLLRMDIAGGTSRFICDAATSNGAGAWNNDDVIVANLNDVGLSRVSANGGTPEAVTKLNPDRERYHNWPQFLPDGKHFIYSIAGSSASSDAIAVGELDSKETRILVHGVRTPSAYLPSGYLLYLKSGALMAQVFDAKTIQLSGAPLVLAEHATAPYAASKSGTVMYRNVVQVPDQFLWIGWDGREMGSVMAPGYYSDPALSPDGSKLAYSQRESSGATMDIYVLDVAAGTPPRRLTSDPADDRGAVWSPDGSAIAFWSTRAGSPGIYRKNASGVGEEELLVPDKSDAWPYQWACSGKCLVYFGGPSVPAYDIFIYDFTERKSRPLISTKSIDADGAISPDGRWLAYEDNSTGRYEAYLTTFPVSSTKLAVTNESGVDSLWSSDGKKLFYVNSVTQELFSLDVKAGNPPEFGRPQRVYRGPLDWLSDHSFDIDTKRQRVIVQTSTASQTDITVLLNWRPQTSAPKP